MAKSQFTFLFIVMIIKGQLRKESTEWTNLGKTDLRLHQALFQSPPPSWTCDLLCCADKLS